MLCTCDNLRVLKIQKMSWYFVFFFVSGFCCLLYEIIWLRLAMAQFGVTTAMVAIVLSVFLGGLGIGSWASGHLIARYRTQIHFPPSRLYALAELLVGISAIAVPYELASGGQVLQHMIGRAPLSFATHYWAAGALVTASLIPWCACMGATYPLAMFAIKSSSCPDSQHSFSYLYLANVLGAIFGATFPLLLVELLGFQRTLYVGAMLNLLIASCAFSMTLSPDLEGSVQFDSEPREERIAMPGASNWKLLLLLFGTGLTSMGAEVIWTRLYTPSVGTFVYAFATILAFYLIATYVGSMLYRHFLRSARIEQAFLWSVLGFAVLIPLLTADPRLPLPALLRVLLGVAPLSASVGLVTPMIVDAYSSGDPDLAGGAYASNILGCVLGPLLSGFVLLPWVGERWSLCILSMPWFAAGLGILPSRRRILSLSSCALLIVSAFGLIVFTEAFEEQFNPREVLRDSTATVIATGSGRGKRLLINGVGITTLTPVTKIMVHLPLALLSHPPTKVLIICFGMGTSHRSALSWHIQSTAVELVPSVPALFSYFHPSGAVGLNSPLSHVVTDDGRSFLERTKEQFDVIAIDPPPPVGAAASSLLYSKEFYALARAHLSKEGILQQWLPGGDAATRASVARALQESFTYVRAFRSIEGAGFHLLGSMSPIKDLSASQLAQRLPPDASHDLVEWSVSTPEELFHSVLDLELPLPRIIQDDPIAPALQDDHPVNEYFLIRRLTERGYWKTLPQKLLGWSP